MWIQVRTFDGKQEQQINNLSKQTKIEDLKERIAEAFLVDTTQERLFFRGKQLEDGHTLFDYNVGLNEIVQLMIKAPPPTNDNNNNDDRKSNNEESEALVNGSVENGHSSMDEDSVENNSSKDKSVIKSIYKKGEFIDAKDPSMGAWFEAEIVDISLKDESDPESVLYHVKYDGYEEDEINKLPGRDIRPRARKRLQWDQLSVGQVVMANYCPDEPKERGFWYDVQITKKHSKQITQGGAESRSGSGRELHAKLILSNEEDSHAPVAQECRLIFLDEIFKIEAPPAYDENGERIQSSNDGPSVKRQNKPDCRFCKDDKMKKCKQCACHQCGGKEDPDKQLLCDECDMAYHIYCLDPPLESIPDDEDWYCPLCKTDASEVVQAGEKLKASKKKSKMASANSTSNRDWGKGMACVGRSKVCSIVPPNHFGPIPGVPVGSAWKFRVQASESGIHRPHVSGIHGRDSEGAYSIVLAGGYEDDLDSGEEFIYTGSGGRDLSGNKRTAEQSCDQKLTKMNRALARNCAAPLNDKEGAEAEDWKKGKPVRVIRSSKLRKHSEYAPEDGNRYDGIYKVVKYWPAKGKSGFIVWRYLFKRDDESPAPWTKEGKKNIESLGLTMVYPEGFLEAQAKKQEESAENGKNKGKGKRKRDEEVPSPSKSPVKKKKASQILSDEQKGLIAEDKENVKLWEELLTDTTLDYTAFHQKVEELFACVCCQDLVLYPVTTKCLHNICKGCLQRSFKAEVFTCPYCRTDLGKTYKLSVNSALDAILNDLFPGYSKGR
ncbi:predicted protein, partial [Nematostella vectensis]